MKTWKEYESAAEQGPLQIFWKTLPVLLVVVGVLWGVGYTFGWFGEAAGVAREELGARALLKKYEWFKEAAAQLEKKQADVKVYEKRITNLEQSYAGQTRGQWPREDREQWSVWQSEVAGVKASYNLLAAEYNAKMAEVHWRFANKGDLPEGATTPLPREFKPYVEE